MSASIQFSPNRLTAGCLALMLSGCAGDSLLKDPQNWLKGPRKKFAQADAKNPAVRVLCLWQPADGNDPKGLPTRGFAGQIFFFTRGSETPVQVAGDARVYLFDDQGTRQEQAKPIHQFDFLGDAWKVHVQESTLGPAYHVFVPYVRKGHHEARCSLRVRLKPAEGPTIFSKMVDVTLPGTTEETSKPTLLQTSATNRAEQDDSAGPLLTKNEQTTRSTSAGSGKHVLANDTVEQTEPVANRSRSKPRRKFETYTIGVPH